MTMNYQMSPEQRMTQENHLEDHKSSTQIESLPYSTLNTLTCIRENISFVLLYVYDIQELK